MFKDAFEAPKVPVLFSPLFSLEMSAHHFIFVSVATICLHQVGISFSWHLVIVS